MGRKVPGTKSSQLVVHVDDAPLLIQISKQSLSKNDVFELLVGLATYAAMSENKILLACESRPYKGFQHSSVSVRN